MSSGKTNRTNRKTKRASHRGLRWGGIWRRLLIGIFLVAVISGGSLFAWRKLRDQITNSPEYTIVADSIEISTPTPEWIRTDVRAEVVRNGSLEGLSSLDRQLTVKVFQAFAMHSWVEEVKRVSKQPLNKVVVDLKYRKPVAMVEVVVNGAPGLFPVDRNGVLLPTADFREQDVSKYIRISVPGSRPTGTLGEPWGDPRIHSAACLAAILQPRWEELGLYRIAINETAGGSGIAPVLEIQSRDGARVLWGTAPDPDDASQLKAAAGKLERLLVWAGEQAPLDQKGEDTFIDLRSPYELR